jgi:hypothetical protein
LWFIGEQHEDFQPDAGQPAALLHAYCNRHVHRHAAVAPQLDEDLATLGAGLAGTGRISSGWRTAVPGGCRAHRFGRARPHYGPARNLMRFAARSAAPPTWSCTIYQQN